MSLGWFLVLLGLYAAAHVGLRLALSPVVAIDDAREALFSQTLQAGYLPRQPPLYNWLAWAGVRGLGVNAAALIVCRYLTLALAYLFLYLSAVRVLESRRLALLAAFSLLLMGPFNWDVHEELTHSLAALAAAAATFHALLRVERSGHALAYVALGVAIAAGFLAKFSYGFFVGSLLLATLVTPAYRRRILSPRIALTLGTAAVLCLPYALWFAHRELSLVRMFVEEVRPESKVGYGGGVARGVSHLGRMLGIYLMPFALVFPAVFWRARPHGPGGGGEARRLLGALLLIELGLVVLGILAGSLTFLKFRWLMPAFCLVPLLAFAWIDQAALDRRMLRRYARHRGEGHRAEAVDDDPRQADALRDLLVEVDRHRIAGGLGVAEGLVRIEGLLDRRIGLAVAQRLVECVRRRLLADRLGDLRAAHERVHVLGDEKVVRGGIAGLALGQDRDPGGAAVHPDHAGAGRQGHPGLDRAVVSGSPALRAAPA